MFKTRLILPIVLVAVFGGAYTAEIPDYMTVCSRNDPLIGDCVKNTISKMRPYLKTGIKELNVPAMEPLYLGDLTLLEAATSGLTVKVRKLNIYGASNFDIKKIRSSDGAKRFDFEILLPRLEGEGSYEINGQILALPIKGNGPFTGNFTNFYAFVNVFFEVNMVNDVDTITMRKMVVKIRTGKGRLKLENLFGGDKALGDVINDTINQNFELFTNEVIEPLERALEEKFTSISRKILENFTYNELFPV